MAFYYKRGKRFWIWYRDGERRIQRPLKTKDGKPVKDEKVAKYLTNEIENLLLTNQSPVKDNNKPALDILDELKEYSKPLKKSRTVLNNYQGVKTFLEAGNIYRITDITETKVKAYLDKRLEANEINSVTANNILKYLKTYINYAIKQNYLTISPLRGFKPYPEDELPPRYLSDQETVSIIKASNGETLYAAIMTAIYTGMRLGEIRALTIKNIDFSRETITIPKSKSGDFRIIPLHPKLAPVLLQFKPPFNFTNHLRVFRRIRRKAEMMDIGWHDFRHNFASQLVMNGVDILAVAELLGHQNIAITKRYARLSPKHLATAITRLPILQL